MYDYITRMKMVYDLLEDDLSRSVFWARMRYDIEPNEENRLLLAANYNEFALKQKAYAEELLSQLAEAEERIWEINRNGGKVIVYGTGDRGSTIGFHFAQRNIDYYGYCGRRANELTNGMRGKPVVSPEWLFEHSEEVYVILGVSNRHGSYDEVTALLRENHFPEDHILPLFRNWVLEPVYGDQCHFEFPEHFRKGTAFVDGGSYNGEDCLFFSRWCGGEYSKIYAFEPDSANYARCKARLGGLKDVEVLQMALSDRDGVLEFSARGERVGRLLLSEGQSLLTNVTSKFTERVDVTKVRAARLDDIVGDVRVGFIKLEIMGAEYDALHGMEKTIARDKPLISTCVYQHPGDMLAVMEYLSRLVPDYRFYLRQYYCAPQWTILFAYAK